MPLLEPSSRVEQPEPAGRDGRRSLARGRLRALRLRAWSEPSWPPRSSRRALRRLRQVPPESAWLAGPWAQVLREAWLARLQESAELLAQAPWAALAQREAWRVRPPEQVRLAEWRQPVLRVALAQSLLEWELVRLPEWQQSAPRAVLALAALVLPELDPVRPLREPQAVPSRAAELPAELPRPELPVPRALLPRLLPSRRRLA